MFHPAAPSSPCGSFSSLTALTRLASREVGAVRASSSPPLLPPVFIPYVALTHFNGPSDSSDLAPRFFSSVKWSVKCCSPETLLIFTLPDFLQPQIFQFHTPLTRRFADAPNSNLVNQNLACSAISGHAECTHQSSPSTFPQSLCVMV